MYHLDPTVTPEQIAGQYPFCPESFLATADADVTVLNLVAAIKWLTVQKTLVDVIHHQYQHDECYSHAGHPCIPVDIESDEHMPLSYIRTQLAVVGKIRKTFLGAVGSDYLANTSPPVVFYSDSAIELLARAQIYVEQCTSTIVTKPYVQVWIDTGVFYIPAE